MINSPGLSGWVNIIDPIASLMLSALLVFLYFRQYGIQKKQSTIQERQEEWMEADNSPKIEILAYELYGENGIDLAKVNILNSGTGTAFNIRCYLKLFVAAVDVPTTYGSKYRMGLDEYSQRISTDYKERSLDWPNGVLDITYSAMSTPLDTIVTPPSPIGHNGYTLHPKEEETLESLLLYQHRMDTRKSVLYDHIQFRDIVRELGKIGLSRINFAIFVRYDDITGKTHDERLVEAIIPVGEETPISKAVEIGQHGIHPCYTEDINVDNPNGEPTHEFSKIRRYKYILRNLDTYLDYRFRR